MKRLMFLLPLAVFIVLAGYFAIGLTLDPRKLPSVLINQEVPPISLAALKGFDKGFSNLDLKGQVSIVNVFGSWCYACLSEHPVLMRIKEQNLVPIYGIDWNEKDPDAGPRWLKKHGNPYTVVGADPNSKAAIAFGVTGAPETFFVDKRGVIRYKHTGPITISNWKRTLYPLIEELRKQ